MTNHETMLRETLLAELGETIPAATVARLFELGLVDIRTCEQRAMRTEIERLGRTGIPRCEAMYATAAKFCCSYEKVRGAFYNSYKS